MALARIISQRISTTIADTVRPALAQSTSMKNRRIHQNPKKGVVPFYKSLFETAASATQDKILYKHVVQIGDPVLRERSQLVNPADIKTEQIQSIISMLKKLLSDYAGVGMSACQAGVPAQIMVIQLTQDQLNLGDQELSKRQKREVIPLKVLINPKMKITDNTQVVHREGCCSVHGFSALVARNKAVTIEALDENGDPVTWHAKDWAARIVQHEMDHIHGRVFTDIMKRESFEFGYWKTVNGRSGQFKLGYSGVGQGVSQKLMTKFLGF